MLRRRSEPLGARAAMARAPLGVCPGCGGSAPAADAIARDSRCPRCQTRLMTTGSGLDVEMAVRSRLYRGVPARPAVGQRT